MISSAMAKEDNRRDGGAPVVVRLHYQHNRSRERALFHEGFRPIFCVVNSTLNLIEFVRKLVFRSRLSISV